MRYLIASLVLWSCWFPITAQQEDNQAVEQVLWKMVDGMRNGDSTSVRSLFTDDAAFFSAFVTRDGQRMLKPGSVDQWITAIGTPHEEAWNEELWNLEVRVDGVLAHVWAPYAFYLGNQFSHCGVNSFHLIKNEDSEWKIFHGTDTRRRSDCESYIPERIKAKYN